MPSRAAETRIVPHEIFAGHRSGKLEQENEISGRPHSLKSRTQLLRFALVGVANTGIHLAVVATLTQFLGLKQMISNVAAYIVASTFSFVVNSVWSFEVKPQVHRYARFQLVAVLSLLVCALLGHIADVRGWPYIITVLLTALIVPAISFVAHKRYTYSK